MQTTRKTTGNNLRRSEVAETMESRERRLRLRVQAKGRVKRTWATETDLIKQVIKVDAGYL